MRKVALLLGTTIFATSCGGGGVSAVDPVSTYRENLPGDSWQYDVQISFGKFGSYTGTLDILLETDTYKGAPTIKRTQVFHLALKDGPATITSYSEYGADGKLLAESVNAVLLDVISNTLVVPYPFRIGNRASGVTTLSDGSTINQTYAVVDAQPVNTPAGPFSCWVVDETAHRSDGTSDTYRIWVAPETGNYARITDTTVNPDGSGYTYTASLKGSISVRPDARPSAHTPYFPDARLPNNLLSGVANLVISASKL